MTYRKLSVMRTVIGPPRAIRHLLTAAVLLLAFGTPATAAADPSPTQDASECNSITCVPGVARGIVKGTYCPDPDHYVFAISVDNQLFFCGSPRGFAPRYFRSPQLAGIRNSGDSCEGEFNMVAQAPDGLYLLCAFTNADEQSHWVPGNYSDYRRAY